MTLRLDFCSYRAARYAIEHWHYSRSMPTPPLVRVGVWEHSQFIGCVLFSRGANNNLGKPYGLSVTQTCELTRVALRSHQTPVSRILAIAIRLMKRENPGLRLIVSFADPNQGHHGGIYQAGGWIFCGQTPRTHKYIDGDGRVWHQRQVSVSGIKPQYGTLRRVAKISECQKVSEDGKFRYLMPLDMDMRAQLMPLLKPYPKRAASDTMDTSGVQPEEGGEAPTAALQQLFRGAL